MTTDPRDEGCTCQRCTRCYKVDLQLDDELWERIHEGYNFLCPVCIVCFTGGGRGVYVLRSKDSGEMNLLVGWASNGREVEDWGHNDCTVCDEARMGRVSVSETVVDSYRGNAARYYLGAVVDRARYGSC